MAIQSLSPSERDIVLQCLRAVSVLIHDWEMHPRIGLSPEELQQVIASWPHVDDGDQHSRDFLAINNALNEICHGLSPAQWEGFVGVTLDEVMLVYQNWIRAYGLAGGIR